MSKRLLQMSNILTILEQLHQINPGEHSILIYPDLTILTEIYSHYCKIRLEKKNDIVLLISKRIDSIINYLENTGISVKKYRKNGSLLTIRSTEKLFGSGADFLRFLDIIEKRIRSMGKNGMSIITEMGSRNGDIKEVIDCEMFVTSTSDIKPASLLCGYHARDFNTLTENQKEILFEQHHKKLIIKDFNC